MRSGDPVVVAMDRGRWDLAESLLARRVAKSPGDAVSLARLAFCIINQGDVERAVHTARRAVASDPDDSTPHYVLGVCLMAASEHRPIRGKRFRLTWFQPPDPQVVEASKHFGKAVRRDGTNQDYYAALAGGQVRAGDMHTALQTVHLGLELAPRHPGLLILLTELLRSLGYADEAHAAAITALAVDPDDPRGHAGLGWQKLAQGRLDEARQHFLASLELDPEGVWARAGFEEALKREFKPYAMIARPLAWVSHYHHRDQVRGSWLISGFLLFAVIGLSGSLLAPHYLSGLTSAPLWVVLPVATTAAGVVGVLTFVWIALAARMLDDAMEAVLLTSCAWRETADAGRSIHLWLGVLAVVYCLLVGLVFALPALPPRAKMSVFLAGGTLVVPIAAVLTYRLRDLSRLFWIGFSVAVAGAVPAALFTEIPRDTSGPESLYWLTALVGAFLMYHAVTPTDE